MVGGPSHAQSCQLCISSALQCIEVDSALSQSPELRQTRNRYVSRHVEIPTNLNHIGGGRRHPLPPHLFSHRTLTQSLLLISPAATTLSISRSDIRGIGRRGPTGHSILHEPGAPVIWHRPAAYFPRTLDLGTSNFIRGALRTTPFPPAAAASNWDIGPGGCSSGSLDGPCLGAWWCRFAVSLGGYHILGS